MELKEKKEVKKEDGEKTRPVEFKIIILFKISRCVYPDCPNDILGFLKPSKKRGPQNA